MPLKNPFRPAPSVERLPDQEAARLYPMYRWSVMESTFIGYGVFYLVRNNLSVVAKDIENALHYDHAMIGNILAISAISYGVGKFVMGTLSDRSNPRVFMAFGLFLTALCNLLFGGVANYEMHLFLWSLNGFIQGMGWPPCGRSMGHWFTKSERGLMFSVWNTSHNVGGGIAGMLAAWAVTTYGGWQYAFVVPGLLSMVGAVYLFWRLSDTPQSVGLPPIEEYQDVKKRVALNTKKDQDQTQEKESDVSEIYKEYTEERELSFREILLDSVLSNKYVWLLAFANFFAYIARYSMLDWGPTYLREVKGASLASGGVAILVLEFGGIPSTILLGWLSDRMGGRRGMIATLCMLPILGAFAVMVFTPPGYLWLDMAMLAAIGFFIYPVINLIVILALDLTSKKAIGAAAGFIGLFGYIGRTVQAKGFGSLLKQQQATLGLQAAWLNVIYLILVCGVLATLLLAITWNLQSHKQE
jgi:OPA family glycerol-3-phosphate transporter-like MFS transporter